MGLYILFGVLAAFGLLCALWAVFGRMLADNSLWGLCLCKSLEDGLAAARRWYWLRNSGLVSCSLILVDCGLTLAEREFLQNIGPWIEICDGDWFPLSELEHTERD